MSQLSKEQEQQSLYSKIWKMADSLRGSVDGWDFRAYFLGFLFYKFLSKKIADRVNEEAKKAGKTLEYEKATDEEARKLQTLASKSIGHFIPPSLLFSNVLKAAQEDKSEEKLKELNETLERVFESIENSEPEEGRQKHLKGIFNDVKDLTNQKLGPEQLSRNKKILEIMECIDSVNFNGNSRIDSFGDAYEFLIGMYSSNAGKSGGEFFTPQEVSRLLARLTISGMQEWSDVNIYDPAAGSGSLLLNFSKLLKNKTIHYHAQEVNLTTHNLCKMNMYLHNVDFHRFHVAHGDTLSPLDNDRTPRWLLDIKNTREGGFDIIVSNPPYSTKWDGDPKKSRKASRKKSRKNRGDIMNDEQSNLWESPSSNYRSPDPRFDKCAYAPTSKADLAFTLHIHYFLANNGRAAIVHFPGALYRGKAEANIRKYLLEQNAIDAVISLPKNLFFGTNIDTRILVLRKGRNNDDLVAFIEAKDEFIKSKNKNKLINIDKIVNAYESRMNIPYFMRLVSREEIERNNYDLGVSRYIESQDEKQQIKDISIFENDIKLMVEKQQYLRQEIDQITQRLSMDAN